MTLLVHPGEHDGRTRMLRTLRGQDVDRPPVWFMRQAGRYLPEYREIRQGTTFEERLHDPELAARLTLQPLRRFPLDCAILFSDLLVPFEALDRPAVVQEGGPVLADPLRDPEDVERLPKPDPARDLPFVGEALQRVREAAPEHAVLGFAGAPFTLACYLIEGRGAKGFPRTMAFAHTHPEAWRRLLGHLADLSADLLAYQASMGADAVQLFDTWAENLAPQDHAAWALPAVQRCVRRFREQSDAPLVHFARGTAHLLEDLGHTGADALSVDWRIPLSKVRAAHPGLVLQGNLDPTALFAPPEVVRARTTAVLRELQGGHVFNLGHGVLPGTPLESVEAMVSTAVAR